MSLTLLQKLLLNLNAAVWSFDQRIKFKIAVLTFKTLCHIRQHTYLSELLVPYESSCNFRSSDQHLLVVPNIKSILGKGKPFLSLPRQSGIFCHFLYACLLLFPLFAVNLKLNSFFLELSIKPDCLHGLLDWYRLWPSSLTETYDLTNFGGLDELNCFCLDRCPWHYLMIVKWTIN